MPPLEPALALIIIVLGGLGITGCEAESSSAPPMKDYCMTYTSGNIGFACHADEDITVDGSMCAEADGERCCTTTPVDAGALFFYPAQSLTKPIPVTHGLVCAPPSISWRSAAAAAATAAAAVAAAVSPLAGWRAGAARTTWTPSKHPVPALPAPLPRAALPPLRCDVSGAAEPALSPVPAQTIS